MHFLKSAMPILIISLLANPSEAKANTTFDHSGWSNILSQYVNQEGLVDYQGLKNDRQAFDQYLSRIESMSPVSHPQEFQTREEELAYYINAYNAQVFKGVLARGPESKSVWRGLISGYNFFVKMKITIGGEQTNLKKLEDDIIRAGFKDPRIHAAINCASISCPRLPQTAFTAAELDQQLSQAMSDFANSNQHVEIDTKTESVRVSKIFDWFKEDFIDYETENGNVAPTLLHYINRYRTDPIPNNYKIGFLKYDKGINHQ